MSSILFGVAVVFTVVPMAVSQCTTSRCAERGYKPPRWENGALYLETLLSETSNTLRKAVEARLVAQSEAMEARLTAQSQAVEKLAKAFDNRFASFEKTLNTRMDAFQASQENRTTDIASDIQRLAEQSSGIATHSAEQSETTKELAKAIDDRFASLEEALNTRMDAMEESNANRTYDITAKMQETIGNITSSMQGLEEHSEAYETRLTEQTVASETRLAQQEVAITSNLTGAIDAKYTSLVSVMDEATNIFNNRVDALQENTANDIRLTFNYTAHQVQGDLGRVTTTLYDIVQRLAEQSMAIETRLKEQTNALETGLAQQEGAITSAIGEQYGSLTETIEELMENGTKDIGVMCQEKVTRVISLAFNDSEPRAQYNLVQMNTTDSGVVNSVEERLVNAMGNLANDLGERFTNETRAALMEIEYRHQDNLARSNISIQNLVRSLKNTSSADSQDTRDLVTEAYNNLRALILELLPGQPIIFLRRMDGSVNFTRPWADYKAGFGDRAREFWLGLDTLHALTSQRQYKLRVELTDWSGERKWEVYNNFSVGGENDKYRLSVSGYDRSVSTTERDIFQTYSNGNQFSTIDADIKKCAMKLKGGWWYEDCVPITNPTGVYRPAGFTWYGVGDGGIKWCGAYNDYRPFKELTLKLIRV